MNDLTPVLKLNQQWHIYFVTKILCSVLDLNRLFGLITILYISLELVISYSMNFVKLTLLWQDRYYNGFNVCVKIVDSSKLTVTLHTYTYPVYM